MATDLPPHSSIRAVDDPAAVGDAVARLARAELVALPTETVYGLAADATIHVLARFTEERRDGLPVERAVHQAVSRSGRAITITSLLLAVAFAINGFSSFPTNAVFGTLGAIIVLTSVLANLIVLPALLTVVYGGRDRRPGEAKPTSTGPADGRGRGGEQLTA